MKRLLVGSFMFAFILNGQEGPAFAQSGSGEALVQIQQAIRELQVTVNELRETVRHQNIVIAGQSKRLRALENKARSRDEHEKHAVRSDAASADHGNSWHGVNPDIGVSGIVQAQLTESSEDGEGRDTIALKELELSIAQSMNPYSRLDAIITFNDALEDQNVEIEEAYYSHWGLPWGFSGRLGKFRAKAGRQNRLHLYQLETVDYPFVIQDFFGEEGMSSSGVRLENQVPNPWNMPLTLSGEVFRGDNDASFSGVSRRPVFNMYLSASFEPGRNSRLEIGSTWMVGDENISGTAKGEDRFGVHIFGLDATLHWFPGQYREIKWQNEIFYQDRSEQVSPNENPWGFYSLLDYRFSRKFSTGVRFDYLQPRAVDQGHQETVAISPYLTFWQSEFANFTLQYRHIDPADPDEQSDDAVFLQANVLIGHHNHNGS